MYVVTGDVASGLESLWLMKQLFEGLGLSLALIASCLAS